MDQTTEKASLLSRPGRSLAELVRVDPNTKKLRKRFEMYPESPGNRKIRSQPRKNPP
jgi:hypothetical protein